MKKFFLAGIFLFCLLTVSNAFAQSVSGTVTDTSKALLPGVTVTLLNTETGVVQTQLSNESGVYIFPSVPFGAKYMVNGTLPGFKTFVQRDISVGTNAAVTVNITMEVGEISNTVDVTAKASTTLLESGPSVGDVLTQDRIQQMPLVGNNVLDLLEILPGLRISGGGSQYDRVGGLGIDEINVTRDGITVSDTRFQAGQTSAFQTDANGGFIVCPTGGFALNNAIDSSRPCSTSYGGSIRQLSTTTLNPDLVGEIKLILSPVDAELGRGNSQIQIQTRSGTNRYTGSASWNIRNTALNANSWANNRNTVNGVWSPIVPDWRNTHNYTISYGGPIVRNKTFFFVSWDQNISNTRDNQVNTVLTDTARQGIFRYWEGWNPQNANSGFLGSGLTGANASNRSVDDAGNPLNPYLAATGSTPVWPNGTPYTGRLVCFSVFGNLKIDGSPFTSADCPSGIDSRGNPYTGVAALPPANGVWDAKRPISNPNGYIARVLQLMPHANDFQTANSAFGALTGVGDGLNSAGFRWVRGRKGQNTNEAVVGSSAFTDRKQINIKIDQNYKSHRISGNWSYQMDDSTDNVASWPTGYSGLASRRPQTLTINATSTLSSTLLNEGRFGLNYNKTSSVPAWFVPDEKFAAEARSFLGDGGSRNGNPYSVAVDPSFFGSNGYMAAGTGQVTNLSFNNPAYTFADTLSWTHGVHSFKFGADVRLPTSDGYSTQTYPTAAYGNAGGATTTSPFSQNSAAANSGGSPQYVNELGCFTQATTCNNNMPIFGTTVRGNAVNLSYLLTDSIGTVQNFYWIDDQSDVANAYWEDVTTKGNKIRTIKSAEYAFFAKDDWRIRRNLTLNLGIRYEYNSPSYLESGLTSAVIDQGSGVFGASRTPAAGGDLFNNWLVPGNLYLTGYGNSAASGGLRCELGTANPNGLPASTCDPNLMTSVEFVGPNSPNPNKSVIPRDRNNFGPAIGFSYQLPWFGEGKTTIRGGYSVQYSRVTVSDNTLISALGNSNEPLGTSATYTNTIAAIAATRAVNFNDLPTIIPANVATANPGQSVPIYARSASVSAYAPDFVSPYTQNLNLSVTRSLSRSLTLDLRYVGTLSRKTSGSLNLNTSTIHYNPELFAAFEAARRGENPKLLDDMLMGLRLPGVSTAYGSTTGMVNGVDAFGGAQLRMSTAAPFGGSSIRTLLANGDYNGLAGLLMGGTGAGSALATTAGVQSTGQPTNASGVLLRNGCNRIANGVTSVGSITNVQTRCFAENYMIANPQLNGGTYTANLGHQNYHSFQAQISMRPIQGISFQSTYAWAKSLGTPGSGYTDPLNRDFDYSQGGGNFVQAEPKHTFRMNGTFELPLGPNKLFFGNASGWVARLIERWSTSVILNMQSGTPFSVSGAGTMRYGNARYNATPLWQIPQGQSPVFNGGADGQNAYYFGKGTFFSAPDPQCRDVAFVTQTADTVSSGTAPQPLGNFCTLEGLSTAQGLVLVNPHPGEYGNISPGIMYGLGSYTVNANIGKTFRLTESKQLIVRMDATNILNHATPAAPSFDATEAFATFGQITGKGGTPRNFQASLRLTF